MMQVCLSVTQHIKMLLCISRCQDASEYGNSTWQMYWTALG